VKALTYIELDIPYCANTYGVAPCTASVPTTGAVKCYNCLATCQDTANLVNSPVTLRFGFPTTDLPADIECIPNLGSIDHLPNVISLGSDLGERASLTVTFKDHPWSDTPNGFDKYFATRTYDPYKQGTFWGKFRARQPYLKSANLRLITGKVGQDIADMETRHFIVDSFSGPTLDGTFTIIGKDVIKLADGEKAQAPVASQGYLLADITAVATQLTLSPTGIGDLEYDASGYVCLAANEVVSYQRDKYTKLLAHFDGANNATAYTEVSPFARVATFGGSAKLSTTQIKFGTASLSLGAAGNIVTFPDSDDFAFSAGDFTIDCFVYYTTVPSGAPDGIFDNVVYWQQDGSSNNLQFGFDGTNVQFKCNNAGVQVALYKAAHGMSNTTWHHWRLVRNGTNIYIFRDGTSLALTVTTAIGATALNNIAAALTLGNVATAGPTFMDEFRILKGFAASTANFAAITSAFALIAVGDDLYIVRGLFNTTAAAHSASDKVQKCLYYNGQDVADVIYDLLVTYTGIDASQIDLTAWRLETSTYLQRQFTAMITDPTAVNDLIDELITEAGLAIWPDDVNNQIRLQVLRAIASDAETLTDDIYKRGTLSISEQETKRLTQVWVHFAKINPTLDNERTDNYRSIDVKIDSDAEANYAVPAIKKIFSRWIPQGGRTIAQRVSDIWLARYVTPPRKISFDVMRYGPKEVILGGGYYITSPHLQDESGAQLSRPIQITQLQVTDTTLKAVSEEANWQAFAYDSSDRTITIDTNSFNLNFKTLHDALYPAIVGGETVTLIIAANADVGSVSTALPALDVGTWPIVPTLKVYVYGRLEGRGGDGGAAGSIVGGAGQNGGDALKTTVAIQLYGNGKIWGGGGGGGGVGANYSFGNTPGMGGGGAGINPGSSGGTAATADAAGGGGASAPNGGGPGLDGNNSSDIFHGGGAKGVAGNSINGVSHVTNHMGTTADIRGPQI
jgi:hypothetical protein